MSTASNVFKTQQEIWKYVADGGSVVNAYKYFGLIFRFVDGELTHPAIDADFSKFEQWRAYIEPVAKTKVWRWERVTLDIDGYSCIEQSNALFSEDYAEDRLKGYTKVPGSEREI